MSGVGSLWGGCRQGDAMDHELHFLVVVFTGNPDDDTVRQICDSDWFVISFYVGSEAKFYLTACVFELEGVSFIINNPVTTVVVLIFFLKSPNPLDLYPLKNAHNADHTKSLLYFLNLNNLGEGDPFSQNLQSMEIQFIVLVNMGGIELEGHLLGDQCVRNAIEGRWGAWRGV